MIVANRRRIPLRHAIRRRVKAFCGVVVVINSVVVSNKNGCGGLGTAVLWSGRSSRILRLAGFAKA